MTAACTQGYPRAGTAGGAGTETGSPGMSSDTGSAMGPMDTALTDTTSTTGTGADTTAH